MIEILDCVQGSALWHAARRGLPTSSNFGAIIAKGEGKMRKSYLHKLAAEIITGEVIEGYKNADMERGNVMEDEARLMYAFMTDSEPTRVGFVRNGAKGCSPDSFIGTDGILEIKIQRADLLVETITKDKFPGEHVAQCQGNLWVSEREWIDIAVFWPGMPWFCKRAYRDPKYITSLSSEVDRFCDDLADLVERIQRYGERPDLMAQLRQSVEQGAAA